MSQTKRGKRLFRFNPKQKKLYASRLTELGNLVAIALVFSQFLAKEINPKAMIAGAITWIILYLVSYYLLNS